MSSPPAETFAAPQDLTRLCDRPSTRTPRPKIRRAEAAALDVVGGHHERYDGSLTASRGRRFRTARIFAVADALNAMTHDRPYRRARPLAAALGILRENAGQQFDPRVADTALKIPPGRWPDVLERTGGWLAVSY